MIDVVRDPQGLQQLREMGLRHVPVLAKGKDYVFAQNLDDLARFVGLGDAGYATLPAAELARKYRTVLRAAVRYVRQVPPRELDGRAFAERDRSIRVLGHHVFRICEAFLEAAVDDEQLSLERLILEPEADQFTTRESIARYGEGILGRFESWWEGAGADAVRTRQLSTYYGTQTVDQLLERSTWHSAQHVRQLMAVLERLGIEPDGRVTAADLAGLPLPENVWD